MSPEIDPSLLQDFLTEAAELIGQLDIDLVKLEEIQNDESASRELLNGIFRALHTVKGAAGFLGLQPLIRFAHAAEDALNKLRKGEVAVSSEVIDALLQSVDVLRGMTAALSSGQEVPECPPTLLDQLHAIAGSEAPAAVAKQPAESAASASADTGSDLVRPLKLPSQKQDLVSFMVTDLQEISRQIEQELQAARAATDRAACSAALVTLIEPLERTLEFFELSELSKLMATVRRGCQRLPELGGDEAEEMLIRLSASRHLVDLQAAELAHNRMLLWPLATLMQRLEALIAGQPLPEGVAKHHEGKVETVLALDGVLSPAAPAAESEGQSDRRAGDRRQGDRRQGDRRRGDEGPATAPADSTVRVEVARLEALLNLVGQLVLNKNRFLGLTRRIRSGSPVDEMLEEIGSAANELDRLTSSLQLGVMRTRMQPMAKLFERYPRVIRDIARATNKDIRLEVTGKETEVDKAVLELLADPLVHILRNSADHGIEAPEVRRQSGKNPTGTIHLTAEHQGNHVRIEIADDGKGLDREVLGRKAVERGLVTAEQLSGMSDAQVYQFIFAAGFSTAEKVTDLSGRGVGMDVVKTNIAKMGGLLNLRSTKGEGTAIEILIPLTVAIMPAMLVGVGKHQYAIPLTAITEIVRPEASALHSVGGKPVMRLRDSVLSLVDLHDRLHERGQHGGGNDRRRFTVVVRVGSQSAGLCVDRLIGQQEVVIKPLDDRYTTGGPFSGATIREDGEVSLILDVARLVRDGDVTTLRAA